MSVREVVYQDVSSGRVHRGSLLDGRLQTFEADNADDAGAYRILTEAELATIPFNARSRRCWPEDDPTTSPVDPA